MIRTTPILLLFGGLRSTTYAQTNISSAFTVDGTSETSIDGIFVALKNDQSAILVENGGEFDGTYVTVVKTGNSSDSSTSSSTALDAAVAVESNGTLTLRHSSVYSDGIAANAVKVYEDGSSAYLYDVSVSATAAFAHGVYIAGGYLYAEDVSVTTNGAHSGAFSTDTGGGILEVNRAKAYTLGELSALVYSTGNITATDLVGSTLKSPAGVIDGTNNFTLVNPTIHAAPIVSGVFQVFNSGGSASGAGKIWVTGGSVSETRGAQAFFFTANAESELYLHDVSVSIKSGIFVNASADYEWGTTGSNGGDATVDLTQQQIKGDVIVDDISSVTLTLQQSSNLTGTINTADAGNVSLSLDATSVWSVTGTSYLTTLNDTVSNLSNIIGNGYTVYYDSSDNAWLDGKTYNLTKGGSLTPQ